jgi:hypothetical protein
MSVSYEDFFSWVLPEVAGCPEITAIQAIRDTVIDFCEKSLIHVVDHDPVKVIAKQSDYELDTPILGHRIIKVMQAYYQGTMLEPVSPDDVTDPSVYNQKIGGYTASYSTPRGFMQKSWDTISLIPIPDQTVNSAVTMRVALAPLRTSTTCENFLLEQYAETIAFGAVAKLQLSAGKPYSNDKAATINNARYMVGLNVARQRGVRGFNRSTLSVQLRKP